MTGDWSADAVTASGAFCSFRHAASFIPAALTARIPKNNALFVTIFLISGFIHITSEMVLVKVYVQGQGNMTILETGEYQVTVPDGNSEIMESEMPGECRASNIFKYLPISVLKYEYTLSIFDNLREHLPQQVF